MAAPSSKPVRGRRAALRTLLLALLGAVIVAAFGGGAAWCAVPAALLACADARLPAAAVLRSSLVVGASLLAAAAVGPLPSVGLVLAVAGSSVAVLLAVHRRMEREAGALRESAARDALTGLANRRAFAERLAYETARHTRNRRPFTVLALDLDGFKAVNDRFGHQAGDELLAEVAEGLRGAVREQDTVARLGGDEFAILAPETAAGGAERLTERIMVAIDRAARGLEGVSASVGSAVFPEDGTDGPAVLEAADAASMALKRRRRGGKAAPAAEARRAA